MYRKLLAPSPFFFKLGNFSFLKNARRSTIMELTTNLKIRGPEEGTFGKNGGSKMYSNI